MPASENTNITNITNITISDKYHKHPKSHSGSFPSKPMTTVPRHLVSCLVVGISQCISNQTGAIRHRAGNSIGSIHHCTPHIRGCINNVIDDRDSLG
jgi:hypothetical protein